MDVEAQIPYKYLYALSNDKEARSRGVNKGISKNYISGYE